MGKKNVIQPVKTEDEASMQFNLNHSPMLKRNHNLELWVNGNPDSAGNVSIQSNTNKKQNGRSVSTSQCTWSSLSLALYTCRSEFRESLSSILLLLSFTQMIIVGIDEGQSSTPS